VEGSRSAPSSRKEPVKVDVALDEMDVVLRGARGRRLVSEVPSSMKEGGGSEDIVEVVV
jgi:hypothetical protein